MAVRRSRALVITAVAVALLVVVAIGARSLFSTARSHFTSDTCTVGAYDLDPGQASVAAAMVGEVTKFRVTLPFRATLLVLMAGLQESKLTNLAPGDGDRDSVGVLQQRPSQGWGNGKAAVLTNISEATREFLEALIELPNWQQKAPAAAIQAVQISADGSAYAQHEDEARTLGAAFQGREPAAISCSFDPPTVVATPSVVAKRARAELGIDTPVAAGRTVRVPGAHWQTGAWFVANADRLGIEQVAYDRRRWTRSKGWQASRDPATAVVATMYRPKQTG